MRVVPTSLPATEPLLLEEVKEHLRIENAEEDTSLSSQIVAARTLVETATGLVLVSRSFDIFLEPQLWIRDRSHSDFCFTKAIGCEA